MDDKIFEVIPHESFLPFRVLFHAKGSSLFHWHPDFECILCLQGEIEIFIRSDIKILHQGEMVFINSWDIHSTRTRKDSLVMVMQIAADYGKKFGTPFSERYLCTDIIQDAAIIRLFLEIGIEYCEKSNAYQFMIESLIDNILVKLIRGFQQESQREHLEEANDFRMIKVLKTLEASYAGYISVSDIAGELNISTEYLSRYFHVHIGCSIRDYINRLRIFHSLPYLDNQSINRIAKNVGFSDSRTYRNAFGKIFGTTPEEWRTRHSLPPNLIGAYSNIGSKSIKSHLKRLWRNISPMS
ncbi:MAG: AraC family transcriptional regulator [Spirochaetota bacterium]